MLDVQIDRGAGSQIKAGWNWIILLRGCSAGVLQKRLVFQELARFVDPKGGRFHPARPGCSPAATGMRCVRAADEPIRGSWTSPGGDWTPRTSLDSHPFILRRPDFLPSTPDRENSGPAKRPAHVALRPDMSRVKTRKLREGGEGVSSFASPNCEVRRSVRFASDRSVRFVVRPGAPGSVRVRRLPRRCTT